MLKKISKNTWLMIVLIIFETILLKCVLYEVFPDKYFFDSSHILRAMNGTPYEDKTYLATANFYNFFNILNLVNIIEWSYVLGLIFSIVFVFLIDKNENWSFKKQLFVFTSVGLLNIYVFNLSKDLIQFIIFTLSYLLYKNRKINNWLKLFFISILFLIEAYLFRTYYALLILFAISIYVLYDLFIKNRKLTKYTIFKFLGMILIIFFIEIFILKFVSYDNYVRVLNARFKVNKIRMAENEQNALTMINDLLGENTNFIKFIINYLINFVRLLVPIELLVKGVKYFPFVIFQLFLTFNMLKISKNIDKHNIILIDIIISYVVLSVIFEPDFGSFIRHETALSLLFIELVNINENYSKKSKKKVLNEKN